MGYSGGAAQMPSGPVSNTGFSSAGVWSPTTQAWVVIGAFAFGFLLLIGWHGIGIRLDGGVRT